MTRRTRAYVLVVMLAFCTLHAACADPIDPRIDAICHKYFPGPDSPGGAVAVIMKGHVVHAQCYGKVVVKKGEPPVTVTPTTPFYLASVSKQFTATCIMILAEHGKLKLDHEVKEYLAGMPQFNAQRPIHVSDLLTMRSGLPEYDLDDPSWNAKKMTEWLHTAKLDHPTGTHYDYINTNYALVGFIVEQVSGMQLKDFMQQAIFTPLKMLHTQYNQSETADGGIYSCLQDMITWEHALRNTPLVSHEMLMQSWSRSHLDGGATSEYGYGWQISEDGHTASHSGVWTGASTYIMLGLQSGESIIVLSTVEKSAPDLAHEIAELPAHE